MNLSDIMPYLMFITKLLLIFVAVAFCLSGLDDLFIDLYYGVRSLYRRYIIMRKYQPLTEEQLLQVPEQPIAVMIPAWQESAVIRRMLENTLTTLNYGNYLIFVGTYPNDPETQREVEIVREKYDNVHRIVCPKEGPTNKADCLNWVYEGVKLYEKEHQMEFPIFVIEDAEDIVHPLSLKLFNYLIPRKDMVQLPVFALETRWYNFTNGTYLDEFAENHYKNLVVREALDKGLPSAGVGCAFSRRALEKVGLERQRQLFNIDSLTEDYEFGIRLKDLGLKGIFVRHAIERQTFKRPFWGGPPRQVTVKEYIAVREYFPATFWTAVRQKSRWIIGITLQGWIHLGWKGPLTHKYMLYRDRKALLVSLINMLGYFVVLVILFYWLHLWLLPEAYHYPPLVERGTWLWDIILADTFLMGFRLMERAYCVGRFYNWREALLSVPRFVWGNVINFTATMRALYQFSRFLLTGKLIAWDKTDHIYPSEEDLIAYRRKLGDLLLERKFITVKQLDEALARQKITKRPLGSILLDMGVIKEEQLISILGQQLRLVSQEINPFLIPKEILQLLPEKLAVKYSVFPLELTPDGRLVLAAHNLLTREEIGELEMALGRQVEIRLATRSDLAFAHFCGYNELDVSIAHRFDPRLVKLMLTKGLINSEQLQQALKAQRQRYLRLGDILLAEGMITPEKLKEATERYLEEYYS